jgi:hypothetical protein
MRECNSSAYAETSYGDFPLVEKVFRVMRMELARLSAPAVSSGDAIGAFCLAD